METKTAVFLARVIEAQVRASAQAVRGINPGEGEHFAERIFEEATYIDHLITEFKQEQSDDAR